MPLGFCVADIRGFATGSFVFVLRKFLTLAKKSVKLYTDNVLEEFYKCLLDGNIEDLHIPHSDVFYVRAAVEAHYGRPFTLEHVEWAMRAEGWTEQSYSKDMSE